ncbi:MAG TPA: hypothetical protein VLL94_04985, partial [Nitrospiraceae bacterium]|nr:hypothetical protein [Nitrospiraceae bacterium]
GATTPWSTLGVVAGALELAAQVEAGELPAPDDLVLALGTGGTAVGLTLGLALARLDARVHAVSAVERCFVSRGRLRALTAATAELLAARGHPVPSGALDRLHIHHGHVGAGYGASTPASLGAVARAAADGSSRSGNYRIGQSARREGRKDFPAWTKKSGCASRQFPGHSSRATHSG